jgi:undecaprenyl-diphosphatase
MSYLQALILGLIQGLTEFFPVSSSAHLKIAKFLLGIEGDHVFFDLSCHLGTLCAVIYYFRREILAVNRKQLFLALVPLVPFYFFLKPVREATSDIHFLAPFLAISAFFLFLGTKWQLSRAISPFKDSAVIGTMQAVALLPGISRSAATISTARVLGWSPKEAVHFSFLLSIPTVLGAAALEGMKMVAAPPASFSFGPCFLGFFASLGMGFLLIPRALKFLEKGNLKPFAWYCLFAAIVVTLLV